jgi:uncharacterized protein YacL
MKQFLKRFEAIFNFLYRPVLFARVIFILLMTWMGVLLAGSSKQNPILFSAIAFVSALAIVVFEYSTDAVSSRRILFAAFGLLVGLIMAHLFYPIIPARLVNPETSRLICMTLFSYFGVILALKHSDWLRPGNLKFFLINPLDRPKVLDSSVIIDGRIHELIGLRLIGGPIVLPTFVLNEIQSIADSSDPYRRARGRRGLEVLDRLRRSCKTLDVVETDFPEIPAVDQKLVQLCRTMNTDLVTNDFNLQKIAELHQINVINLNELADALRPTVYIGETMELTIVKPGKEAGQGVGYLDDGTMIVVEGADNHIGHTCDIVVSNILQNPSGRLIFARLKEEEPRQMRA